MGKIADRIIFGTVILFISFSWGFYATESAAWGALTAVCALLLAHTGYAFYRSRKKSIASLSPLEMCRAFALMGQEKAAEHIYSAIPESLRIKKDCSFLIVKYKEKEILISVNYKFANTSEEDVAKTYRKAKELQISEVYILSRATDRKTMVFAAGLDVNFKFYDKRSVKKYLLSQNKLPEKAAPAKKKRVPFDFKALFSVMLDKRRIKYYFFAGAVLFTMSFFTPLRLYYAIVSTVPLALAGLSAVVNSDQT